MTRRDVLVPSAQAEHNRQDSGSEAGLNKLMDIISEESGIEKRELSDDVELGDLGIDSLLSLLIASRLKDDLGFNLGSGITLFDEFKTLSSLKSAYLKSKGLSPAQSLASPKDGRSLGPLARPSESEFTSGKDQTRCLARPVTSLLLQEASALDSTMLFLFPDGSGSAASYVSLPLLSPKVTVVALISPYRHEAETMTCTLDSLLLSYIAEIKRRQPTGSYALGGWSSGGVFAYCAAQMLLDEGNSVSHILLLDSPPLKLGGGLGQLPDRFYDHCRKSGVFGQLGNTTKANKSGTESTDGLIAHFKATVNLLARFHAKPLTVPQGLANPRVSLCWAGKSALDGTRYGTFERESGDSTDVGFLVEARQDFGAGSWAELFPEIKINVVTLHDWDHFNMMVGDGAKSLGDFITECISCS
jgi:thioesterase domain-containing protein/acyl carrier protein